MCILAALSQPGLAGNSPGEEQTAQAERCVPGEAPERLSEEQLACLGEPDGELIRELQEADPAADARREAGEGDFRLVRFTSLAGSWEPGVTCAFKPPWALTRAWLQFSNITDLEYKRFLERARLRYANAYNRTIATHAGFPYPEICRPRNANEKEGPLYRSLSDFRRRPQSKRRAQSLHEAVRLHDRAAVRRFLKQGADGGYSENRSESGSFPETRL